MLRISSVTEKRTAEARLLESVILCDLPGGMAGQPPTRASTAANRALQYLSPRERMFALVALGVAAQQHETRRRRHQEATATHGAAATDDDHELWLRSSGAVNADGKGLLRRKEARFVEDWWCARAGNEEIYACRARAARRQFAKKTK